MKALTLTQPWASLVALGAKRIETRSWRTSYRGPLAIHAAKGFPNEARRLCMEQPFRYALFADLPSEGPFRDKVGSLPLGEVVATCMLLDCLRIGRGERQTVDMPGLDFICFPPDEPERSFGDFRAGRYAWILDDVRPLHAPVPAKGALGLWEWRP